MLCIVGTVPSTDFPIVEGEVKLKEEQLHIGAKTISINRGTPALLAAAVKIAEVLGQPAPYAYLVGDTGTGKGSRRLYAHLTEVLPQRSFQTITFHYLQPLIPWHKRLQSAISAMPRRPQLIADAGFMYMAKMSGAAADYDLFTPDVGELAFLADEQAPHPFYTRGFILHEDNLVLDLIARAYKHRNAARYLLIKGKKDCLADSNGILESVDSPMVEMLEAIGGTGDTLTGLVSTLIDSGAHINMAAVAAMRINRLAGQLARPTPATQIMEIIAHIPQAHRTWLKDDVPVNQCSEAQNS